MPSDDEKQLTNESYNLEKYLEEAHKAGYDQDNFYFRSTDDKGHSTTLRLCIPLYLGGDLKRIVDTGYFPYRTPEDIGRDALYHRVHHLNGVLSDPTVTKTLHMEAREAFYDQIKARAMAEEGLVDRVTDTLSTLARLKSPLLTEAVEHFTHDALDLENPKARKRAMGILEKYGYGR